MAGDPLSLTLSHRGRGNIDAKHEYNHQDKTESSGGADMLKWAAIFFIISLIAGLFGFTNIAAGTRGIAKVLFIIALILFLIILVFGVFLGVLVF